MRGEGDLKLRGNKTRLKKNQNPMVLKIKLTQKERYEIDEVLNDKVDMRSRVQRRSWHYVIWQSYFIEH